ncbi:glutamate-cysteine ligase family protein [Actinoallomurus sp. NBC_01490]|uniref:glutamate-cysteine ligase family protein n=1 Tax=Actinoallomurus sp. NBC_01490 TaxID=2903557 RepID=UPI002E35F604|nr:glutamate-cysteine ligase family protein [Actinoallomurus sp. NBC_01490]
MGRDVAAITVSTQDRRRYREKVQRCLEAFAAMLRDSRFAPEPPSMGMEIELTLVDDRGRPAMRNAAVLDAIADDQWSTELAQCDIEVNLPPFPLAAKALGALEQTVRDTLNDADARARQQGARLMLVGILPTLREADLTEETLSANPRYRLLNEQIITARGGEALHLDIDGHERLRTHSDSISPEAACTSVQYHLQVTPEDFGAYWNASQMIAGVQAALAANSPFLFGRELWAETRIPLFEQATDTRAKELREQGVRPRVWFGERWITSVLDLFEENSRYFSPLLPVCDDGDPLDQLARGDAPGLNELTLHNGTIYRWNRPVYDIAQGRPHLRVENRVLPAGPTVADTLANGAFYYGLIRALADEERPPWHRMPFAAAAGNLRRGARYGMDAMVVWPGVGEVAVTDLVLRLLLPQAAAGLDRWGVDGVVRDRLLGIIEQRCLARRNGATWQAGTVRAIGGDRQEALRRMVRRYLEHMHTNAPVHTWPIG